MKVFEFEGKCYRSMRLFCQERGVSYQKMRRLCRHYMRAHKDPTIAAKWLLGIEPFKSNEPKTFLYEQDLQKSEERNSKFKDKMYQKFIDNF